ncbi:hypothetical protein [Sphaerothrix gracilis]
MAAAVHPAVGPAGLGKNDSVGGFRDRLEFESIDGDRFRLIWAGT